MVHPTFKIMILPCYTPRVSMGHLAVPKPHKGFMMRTGFDTASSPWNIQYSYPNLITWLYAM